MRGTLPADIRLYAIGDIHGCDTLLEQLLARIIEHDAARQPVLTRRLIFLGDYVDRGPDSRAVIERLLHALPEGFERVFLKGNHEAMMIDCLAGRYPLPHWFINGGKATFESYGIPCRAVDGDYDYDLLLQRLRERIDDAHMRFLTDLWLNYRCGGYYFVHAGINPDRSLAQQREQDQLWIRDRFLDAPDEFEAVIVHGHTPVDAAELRANRIGIDTGAVYGGKLTAVCLEGDQRELISVEAPPQLAPPRR